MVTFPIPIDMKKIEKFCRKYHIVCLSLFGSVLTQSFSDNSDVDILINFDKKNIPHLLGLVRMESELSEIIGRQVDMKTENDLSPYFRKDVLARAKIIYGK